MCLWNFSWFRAARLGGLASGGLSDGGTEKEERTGLDVGKFKNAFVDTGNTSIDYFPLFVGQVNFTPIRVVQQIFSVNFCFTLSQGRTGR